jgi:hypothetical protein
MLFKNSIPDRFDNTTAHNSGIGFAGNSNSSSVSSLRISSFETGSCVDKN